MRLVKQAEKMPSLLVRILFQASYRWPMEVSQVMVFPSSHGESGYYVCPHCGRTMEREFTTFCGRCGQRLDWSRREAARVVYPGGG